MTVEHDELMELLPHRGKMFLVGRISDASVENWTIESETEINEDFMFFDRNAQGAPNYSCFEIIAQTVASLTGLNARENNLKPRMGMILSVTNLHFDFDLMKAGQKVTVKACRELVMDNMYSFKADVYLDGKKSGSGKITVMAENV